MKLLSFFQHHSKSLPVNPDLSRLRRYGANHQDLKLHFGCGPRILKGWANIDLVYEPPENYLQYYRDHYTKAVRGSKRDFFAINVLKESLPLPDRSVSVIFHEDFIEHLTQKEQFLFLAETYRVLKRGGIHRINTPDLVNSMKLHSKFSQGRVGVYVEEWERHGHHSVLSHQVLTEMATIVGYRRVVIQKRDQSLAKGLPTEYRPDPHDRPENGNIFVDLVK